MDELKAAEQKPGRLALVNIQLCPGHGTSDLPLSQPFCFPAGPHLCQEEGRAYRRVAKAGCSGHQSMGSFPLGESIPGKVPSPPPPLSGKAKPACSSPAWHFRSEDKLSCVPASTLQTHSAPVQQEEHKAEAENTICSLSVGMVESLQQQQSKCWNS